MNRHVLCSTALRTLVPMLLLGGLSLQAAITAPSIETYSIGSGLTASGYTQNGLSLTASVDAAGEYLLYQYVVEFGPTDGKDKLNQDLSHFIINLSVGTDFLAACGNDPYCFQYDGPAKTEIGTWNTTDPSNPGLPQSFYGVKFDGLQITQGPGDKKLVEFSFLSNRIPVYGPIYGKAGSSNWFYAAQAIVPDSQIWTGSDDPGAVPEPGTYAMLGAGLLGLAILRRR